MKRIMSWTVMLLVLLAAATEASAAVVNFSDYFFPSPLSRYCRYNYVTPTGFAGFTITVTKLTSGQYAGHYRWGTYNIPDNEEAAWRIADFDYRQNTQSFLLYADSLIGDLQEPVSILATYTTDTPYSSPFSTDIWWYFRFYNSFEVGGKTYENVMLWVVFDSKYPATGINTLLGLPTNYGMVSTYSYYAKGIGELLHTSADNGGNVRYQYQLQSTGVHRSPAGVALLLD
jgi:hypothetical protein